METLMLDDEKVLVEDEVIETTEEVVEDDKPEAPAAPEELTVTIGETPSEDDAEEDEIPQEAPTWVRDTRKRNRELQKINLEKDREIERLKRSIDNANPSAAASVLGPEPMLEDYDYDQDELKKAHEIWIKKKIAIESAAKAESDAWQTTLSKYNDKEAELAAKLPDFKEAREIAFSIFGNDKVGVMQQGVVIDGCDNPALVVYALGKNPTKARELASIKNAVKFAFEVAKLEGQLKMTPKKKAPAPEKMVEGGSAPSSSSNQTLERLRADAEKSGDYSKVREYKRKIKK